MSQKQNLRSWILFEDDNYIVVNKPPYVSTLEDRTSPINISEISKAYHIEAQVCHRLDKETSGVLLIAKNPEAYRHAAMQFEKRTIEKIYHAVVEGVHEFRSEQVNASLILTGKGKMVINQREGKEATTYVSTLGVYGNYSLIECKPVTGRMHQIRVHLASLNAPIVNDELYGGKPFYLSSVKRKYNLKRFTEERPLIQRFALHAYSLSMEGMDGKEVTYQAPYPKDFRVLVEQLEKNS
ncbi:MAG: RluA family pseudouridine synthase [Cyclobacteriaceae bacterium]|nr:RluA family pseudouridine synthase [Cyclobacteriaceae bacterium]